MVGRPRSAECDAAILEAALHEYAQRGFEGLSVDAVAARAGVSKATIYRRYPSKITLVVASAESMCAQTARNADTGDLRTDIVEMLSGLVDMLQDPVVGAAKRMLVVDSISNPELADAHRELVRQRRESTFAIFRRAIDRGELPADLDMEFAADELGGPVFYRYLLMHDTPNRDYVEQLADAFISHHGVAVSA
jgi:AcrR family transcriptional regulator